MNDAGYTLAASAVDIATRGLARAHEDAEGEAKDFYLTLGVTLDECLRTRPHADTMLLCLVTTILLEGGSVAAMNALRDRFSAESTRLGGFPINQNLN